MKKTVLLLFFCMATACSYADDSVKAQRSDRKIIEISKIVSLSKTQEMRMRLSNNQS